MVKGTSRLLDPRWESEQHPFAVVRYDVGPVGIDGVFAGTAVGHVDASRLTAGKERIVSVTAQYSVPRPSPDVTVEDDVVALFARDGVAA